MTDDEIFGNEARFMIDLNNLPASVWNMVPDMAIERSQWGVYTRDKTAAEGLAWIVGGTDNPEISKSLDSAYYHYHDAMHAIHIWYGFET